MCVCGFVCQCRVRILCLKSILTHERTLLVFVLWGYILYYWRCFRSILSCKTLRALQRRQRTPKTTCLRARKYTGTHICMCLCVLSVCESLHVRRLSIRNAHTHSIYVHIYYINAGIMFYILYIYTYWYVCACDRVKDYMYTYIYIVYVYLCWISVWYARISR